MYRLLDEQVKFGWMINVVVEMFVCGWVDGWTETWMD